MNLDKLSIEELIKLLQKGEYSDAQTEALVKILKEKEYSDEVIKKHLIQKINGSVEEVTKNDTSVKANSSNNKTTDEATSKDNEATVLNIDFDFETKKFSKNLILKSKSGDMSLRVETDEEKLKDLENMEKNLVQPILSNMNNANIEELNILYSMIALEKILDKESYEAVMKLPNRSYPLIEKLVRSQIEFK